MTEVFLAALATAAAKKGVSAVAQVIGEAAHESVAIDTSQTRAALLDHLQLVSNWAEEHTLADPTATRALRDIYVELQIAEGEARSGRKPGGRTRSVTTLIESQESFVILGPPGAGKTTTLQHVARALLEERDQGRPIFPLLVRFRSLRQSQSLFQTLLLATGVTVRMDETKADKERREKVASWERRALSGFLESIGAVLLLDGLDEAPHLAATSIVAELGDLLLHGDSLRAIVTCRLGAYTTTIPRTRTVTLLPLRADQVDSIAHRWFNPETAHDFLARLRASPVAGTEVVPLVLSQLCAVFERRGDIPERPTELYEVLVRLLIEDFDIRRGIIRRSHYARLTPTGKERFLRAIAHELTRRGYRGTFAPLALEQAYIGVCDSFDLPRDEARRVAREIESHTGLLVKTADGAYSFPHKTYQEYLTACHLLSVPHPFATAVPRMPDELAIMIALSPEPTEFVGSLLEYCLGRADDAARACLPQFLERIAIERPDFRPSARLGWTILGICHLILSPSRFGSPGIVAVDQASAIVAELCRDSRVARSLAVALDQSSHRRSPGGQVGLSLRPGIATSGEELVTAIFEKEEVQIALPEHFLAELERSRG